MNAGPNKGRRLRAALSRFAAMLIEEARDITGFSYAKLDEELGLPDGHARRYSLYPMREKTRAPQAGAIQQLENRVARLLKRTAHTVVVENNLKMNLDDVFGTDHVEGRPGDILNLRDFDSLDFQLGYDGDWPTYRRLKYNPTALFGTLLPIHELVQNGAHDCWPDMLKLYAWQWGILWDKGLPWLIRETLGAEPNMPVEKFLPEVTENAKRARVAIASLGNTAASLDLLSTSDACFAEATKDVLKQGGKDKASNLPSDVAARMTWKC